MLRHWICPCKKSVIAKDLDAKVNFLEPLAHCKNVQRVFPKNNFKVIFPMCVNVKALVEVQHHVGLEGDVA